MQGTRLSRYRLLEQIGAGGMGVVYRAQDERLMRDVAIKVIGPGLLTDDAARRRFRKEALALSQLSHPNIAVIHDFDTHEGVDFLVMEYIAGVTLEQRLAAGPIPEPELLPLALQLVEALCSAHDQGVVHRDLKPGNLRITPEGRLKVLDFGLARILGPGTGAGLTATLSEGQGAAGTLAYMPPEVLGGAPADERSDLYSLGAVLYEMATGCRPFAADSALALMYAVLNSTPAPPRGRAPGISPRLEEIILRALDRDPARRPSSARDVRDDLKRLAAVSAAGAGALGAAAGGAARIESIAVLPLENLSGDPAQEFFADGMTEALIADLAKVGALRVISRTSVMCFKGVHKPLPEIARELRVDAIVEGSVVRGGDRVRITAQLIDARTDTHLWAESYERAMSDVLSLQGEVARAIAREVHIKLAPLAAPRKVDPEAYEYYLKGRYCWNRRTEDDLRRAVECFRLAIDRDPSSALAYAGLADAHNLQGFFYIQPPAETFAHARAMALRAIELDPSLGEAHNSLAYARLYYDWDWAGAEGEFRRAIELSPNYSVAHLWYANLLPARGRFEEALAEGRKARELDPLSIVAHHVLGWVYFFMRDFERSLSQMQARLEVDRQWVYGYVWTSWPMQQLGRHDEAIANLEQAVDLSGGTTLTRASLAHGLALGGRDAEARALLAILIEQSSTRYVSPFLVALVWIGLGERDHAFEWLEKACDDRSHWLVFVDVDARLDPVRDDPRFESVRRRVGVSTVAASTGGAEEVTA